MFFFFLSLILLFVGTSLIFDKPQRLITVADASGAYHGSLHYHFVADWLLILGEVSKIRIYEIFCLVLEMSVSETVVLVFHDCGIPANGMADTGDSSQRPPGTPYNTL